MTATNLTDRYVWAATRTVPDHQRAELARELRERIGDSTDAFLSEGRAPAEAERAALVELGDPAALAADYVDRPLQLIGPRYFLIWWRLLKMLFAIVLPIVVGVVVIVQVLASAPAGEVIGNAIGVMLSVGVHLAFWTTLAFAIVERMPNTAGAAIDVPWTPEMLPQAPEPSRSHRLTDLVASVVFLALFAVVLVWQQFGGIPYVDVLDGVPLLDPALWSFWLPYFLVLIAVEIGFAVLVYLQGWTWSLAAVNVVLNLAFTVPALWLLLTGQLLNPEALDAIGWPWGDAAGVTLAVVVIGVIAAAAWDVIDGFIKAWRAGGERRLETDRTTQGGHR